MTTTEQTPVFVDPTGRRRRVLRVLIAVAVAGVLVYLALLVVALSGGPVRPSSLLPIPAAEDAPTATTTAPPTTTTTAAANDAVTGPATPARTTAPDAPEVTTTTAQTTPSTPGSRRTDPPGASNRPTPPGKG